MNSWRPKDWKNPIPIIEPIPNEFPTGSAYHKHLLFENGADAMLQVLRNNQWCPFDSSIWQANFRGKIVIIPEDEEGKVR